MSKVSIPSWEELPELDLYLDQILLLINPILESYYHSDEKGLTPSMINNYVKHGYVEKPTKKKYQKHQVARFIAISVLKPVFSIQEVSHTLDYLHQQYESRELYNFFVTCMREASDNTIPEIILTACESVKLYYKSHELVLELEEK